MAISITSRVRSAMVGLSFGLCLLFTILIFMLVYIIEDQVFVNQIKVEQAAFERVVENAKPNRIDGWSPSNKNIKRFDSLVDLPHSLPAEAIADIVKHPGVHEYFDDDKAMFIANFSRPNTNQPYYLVYDVKELLVVRDTKRTLFLLIGGLTLAIAAVSVLLARRLSKSTLEPITRLSHSLKNNELDHAVIDLANEFSEDEVGVLTRELVRALEQVREAAQREYEFNRGVSHELRSPIQVAQSATELLQVFADQNPTQRIDQPLARLQRSVTEMNEVCEAFLWLASDRVVESSEKCSTTELRDALGAIQARYPSADIVVSAESVTPIYYQLPNAVLSLVLRNLIRNAMSHGDQSQISVELQTDRIKIVNSVESMTQEHQGFGVGLSIVQRICDRFNCELKTELQNDMRYLSSIRFSSLSA